MDNFIFNLLSPIIAAAISVVVFGIVKAVKFNRPCGKDLFRISIISGAIGAGLSLIHTVGWMVWYEATSGYSAGNAPVFWIFFSGPLSFAAGEVIALVLWLLERPQRIWGRFKFDA